MHYFSELLWQSPRHFPSFLRPVCTGIAATPKHGHLETLRKGLSHAPEDGSMTTGPYLELVFFRVAQLLQAADLLNWR